MIYIERVTLNRLLITETWAKPRETMPVNTYKFNNILCRVCAFGFAYSSRKVILTDKRNITCLFGFETAARCTTFQWLIPLSILFTLDLVNLKNMKGKGKIKSTYRQNERQAGVCCITSLLVSLIAQNVSHTSSPGQSLVQTLPMALPSVQLYHISRLAASSGHTIGSHVGWVQRPLLVQRFFRILRPGSSLSFTLKPGLHRNLQDMPGRKVLLLSMQLLSKRGTLCSGISGRGHVMTQKALCADHLPSSSHVTLPSPPLILAPGAHFREHFLPNVRPCGQSKKQVGM